MTTDPVAWRWGEVDASPAGDDLCLAHRHANARMWVRGGRLVRGAGYERADRTARRALARTGAIVRLRQRGRYLVHASGAVDPVGRAWLMSGDSGCGKSTLAYALARAGWRILGDDGVLVEISGGVVSAHGWRDPLAVSSTLSTAFPELGAHPPRTADQRGRVPIEVSFARTAPVAAIVFVQRASRLAIEPLAPIATLAALIRQSPWVILDDAYARAHLDALRLAAALPSFSLRHTPAELHTIARVLAEVLA
jgi:predicted ATPase